MIDDFDQFLECTSGDFFENYLEHVREAIRNAGLKVERDMMSGAWDFRWRDFIVYATPFFEGATGIPVSIMDHDGNEVAFGLARFVMTGDPIADALNYVRYVRATIDSLLPPEPTADENA